MSSRPSNRPLSKVLYVRVDERLSSFIKQELDIERERRPGANISQASMVRQLLWQSIASRSSRRINK